MTRNARLASIIVNGALDEMARISGASQAEILEAMMADPNGNTARRFREYLALGVQAVSE